MGHWNDILWSLCKKVKKNSLRPMNGGGVKKKFPYDLKEACKHIFWVLEVSQNFFGSTQSPISIPKLTSF